MKFEPTPANIIAKAISGVVHPLAMPVLGALLVLNLPSPFVLEKQNEIRNFILAAIFVCTFALPILIITILRYRGHIQSIHLNEQKDRRVPFIFTGICYSLCYWVILKLNIPRALFPFNMAYPLMLGATVSVIIALLVNNWFKISIHMMGIGGLTGAVIAISLKYGLPLNSLIYGMVLLCGITGYARLQLNAHTPAQVYTGFLVSLSCNFGLVYLL